MLLNPERNTNIKIFLNEIYTKLSFLTSELSINNTSREEYRWSIVMDYILLKSMGNNILSEFLSEKLGETYENYKLIFLYKLKKKLSRDFRRIPEEQRDFYLYYFEKYLVNSLVLRESLFTMRTDAELKMYFSLFGGGFCPQEQENYDGTGALYFTKNDFKPETNYLESKLKILQEHFKKSDNNTFYVAAQNNYAHWVAIGEMKENLVIINNPLWKGISTQKIMNRSRFYLFYYNPSQAIILNEEFMRFFESEIEKEKEIFKEFTENLRKIEEHKKKQKTEQNNKEQSEKKD